MRCGGDVEGIYSDEQYDGGVMVSTSNAESKAASSEQRNKARVHVGKRMFEWG